MIGLKIFFGIIFIAMFVIMNFIMIIFERNKTKNIIFWLFVFLFTTIIGYILYAIYKIIYINKRKSLVVKEKEDDIYNSLISSKLKGYNYEIKDDLLEFNQTIYNAKTTENNDYEFFNNYSKFKDNLIKEIKNAKEYIFLQINKFDYLDFEEIKNILLTKAKDGICVRFNVDSHINRKLKKELKGAGVKINRFSKCNTVDKVYSNLRNIISIDGKTVYVGNFLTKKIINLKAEVANLFVKFKGEIVQELDLILRKDCAFASGKYIEYTNQINVDTANEAIIQSVSNTLNHDFELMLIKAICEAKKSIQLQLDCFIPSDNFLSLLKYAATSNIDVKLIVSIKAGAGKSYATRAYAKELALSGANVYLYDGYLNYNAITIDNKYVLFGSYSLDRNKLNNCMQNVVIIKDEKAVNYFNKQFDAGVNNSYRINDAKFMLKREKLFKNLV